jgi:GTP cyclohydrolase II
MLSVNVKEVFKTYMSGNGDENGAALKLCEKYPFLLHPTIVSGLCQLPDFCAAFLSDEPPYSALFLPKGDTYSFLDSDVVALLTTLRRLRGKANPSVEEALQWRKAAFEAAANSPADVSHSVYYGVIITRLAQHVGPNKFTPVTKFHRDMPDKFYPFDPLLEPDVLLPNLEEFNESLARVYSSEELARIIGCIRRQCGWESTQKIRNESAYFATAITMLEAEGRVITLHNENPAYWISEVGGAPRWGWWCK